MGPIVLLDTAGCEMEEDATEGADESKRNQGEAKVAIHHCVQLLKAGIRPQDIGIITPYNAQVRQACCAHAQQLSKAASRILAHRSREVEANCHK